MDDLVAALVAEQPFDLARVGALDPLDLRRRVADEAASELATVRTEAAHAVARPEGAVDGPDAGRQEAPPPAGEGALRAVVDVEGARGAQGVRDPVLAPREAI